MHMLLPDIPAGTSPTAYYLLVGLAVLITGISKSGFGGGVGILAIPLMALAMPPKHMLGIMLPLLIACDILSNLHHIGFYDWKKLRALVPGLLAGIVIGTIVLWAFTHWTTGAHAAPGAPGTTDPLASFNRLMNGVVGGICLAVVLMLAYRLTGREIPTLPPHPASAATVGAFAGFVSTLNHSAGPIVTVYLMQEKLEKRFLVGTLLLYFLIGNSAKLPTYILLPMADGKPLITLATLQDSIWFIPLIPLGTMLGAWMHHRVPEKPFSAIMYIAAGITAGDMICKAAVMHSMFDFRYWLG